MNKFIKISTPLILLMYSHSGFSGFNDLRNDAVYENTNSRTRSDGNGGAASSSTIQSNFSVACDRSESQRSVSPDFIKNVLGSEANMDFVGGRSNRDRDKLKFKINFPKLLNIPKCFKPVVAVDQVRNNKVLRFVNGVKNIDSLITMSAEDKKDPKKAFLIKNLTNEPFPGDDFAGKAWTSKLPEEEKVIRCMALQYPELFKNVEDSDSKYTQDADKWKRQSSNVKITGSAGSVKDINQTKNSKFLYAIPKFSAESDTYPRLGSQSYHRRGKKTTCFDIAEIPNSRLTYIVKTDERKAFDLLAKACAGQDPLLYLKGMSKLDKSTAGNSRTLMENINETFLHLIDSKTQEIEKNHNSIKESITKKAQKVMDADEENPKRVRKAAKEYLATLKNYKSKVLTPVGELLNKLQKMYSELGDDEANEEIRNKLSEKMLTLNEIAKSLSEGSKIDVLVEKDEVSGRVIDKIKKFVDPSLGSKITIIFKTSSELAKVCEGDSCFKSSGIEYVDAVTNIKDRKERFSKYDAEDWYQHKAAHLGYEAPLREKEEEIQYRQKRLLTNMANYKKQETKGLNQACTQQQSLFSSYDPYQCIVFRATMDSRRKRFTAGLQGEADYIGTLGSQYRSLSTTYDNAQARILASGDTNLSQKGINFMSMFNGTALNSDLNSSLLYSLSGRDSKPQNLDLSMQRLMQQQQLQQGAAQGQYRSVLQPSPFIQNGGAQYQNGMQGMGNTLLMR